MVRVMIEGWDQGLNKVQLNHLLRQYGQLRLAEAKQAVDQVLAGERVTFLTPDPEAAEAFCSSAKALGALCSFATVESEASMA
jgi:hypothetical protein